VVALSCFEVVWQLSVVTRSSHLISLSSKAIDLSLVLLAEFISGHKTYSPERVEVLSLRLKFFVCAPVDEGSVLNHTLALRV